MKNIILFATVFSIAFIVSCKSKKETVWQDENSAEESVDGRNVVGEAPRGRERKGPPSIDQIFKMDTNNDGKLSLAEVKGPLQRDFEKIDADGDGFISREEFEKAPKPQKGQGRTQGRQK